ncbi:MAG TPA: hypothetical protein P5076_13510, partial [Myxococcota bacterium]|nr:hypothetical protein [Myxococcota bacterium]
ADRKAIEEAAAKKKILEEELARQKTTEEEAAQRRTQEEEAARQKALAEEAARQKALQEEAARQQALAEEASKKQAEAEPEGGIGDHLGVVGAHLGLLSPGLGDESGVFLEWQAYEGEAETDIGVCLDLGLDFLIGRYFSLGLAVGYLRAETRQTFEQGGSFLHDDTFDYMAFSLRLKGRLPIAEVVELRLGLNVGAGLWIHAPKIEVARDTDRFSFDISSGFAGVAAGGLLEVSWWVLPELGLVFGFGVMAQPTGPIEGPPPPGSGSPETSVTYDMMFPPRLTITLGAEYGF